MDKLTDRQREQLAQDLPGPEVRDLRGKKDEQGNPIQYVESHYIISRLNAVFGFDGWSISYGAPTVREGARPVVHVVATLTAAGVNRTDIGVGIAATDKPDSFETAIKAAYTDGLKRCARMFGSAFGLALYDKQRDGVGYSFATQDIIAAFDAARDLDAHKAAEAKSRDAWQTLPADERKAIADAQARSGKRLDAAANQTAPKPSPTDAADAAIAAFKAAKTRVELDAATATHGPQLAKLPENDPKRAKAKDLLAQRRSEFLTAAFKARADAAKSHDELAKINEDLTAACAKRLLSQAQAEDIVSSMNATVAALHEAA